MKHETIFLDPDFRKNVDTLETHCHVCQRKLNGKKAHVFVSQESGFSEAVHPDDVVEGHGKDVDRVALGPECSKKVPSSYLVP